MQYPVTINSKLHCRNQKNYILHLIKRPNQQKTEALPRITLSSKSTGEPGSTLLYYLEYLYATAPFNKKFKMIYIAKE